MRCGTERAVACGALPEGAPVALSDAEFSHFQRFIFEAAGITLGPTKKALVSGRLGRRLAALQLPSYREYFQLLNGGEQPDEVQRAVDLLTTNETYFFREARHFDHLRAHALARRAAGAAAGPAYRAWSAASSSGEEAYSIAMVLADCLGTAPWQVLGTDISQRMLQDAVRGVYPMERARRLPPELLQRHCLKGTAEHAGQLLIGRPLRESMCFGAVNLNQPLPDLGRFDFVFLRNVMIYFNDETKRQVVARVLETIKPGGCLCVGHAESLGQPGDGLRALAPSLYVKTA